MNQQDLDERSKQVSLMYEIYGHANRTLMFAGVGDEYAFTLHDLEQRWNHIRLTTTVSMLTVATWHNLLSAYALEKCKSHSPV